MNKRIQLRRSKDILQDRELALSKIGEVSGQTMDGEPIAVQYLNDSKVETIIAIKAKKSEEDRGAMVLFDSAQVEIWDELDEKVSSGDLKTVNGHVLFGSGDIDAKDVVYMKKSAENAYHEAIWGANRWIYSVNPIDGVSGKLYLDVATKQLYMYTSGFTALYDFSNYYNKTEINDMLDDKLDVSAYTPSDLSNYYNKTEVDDLLDDKLDASAYTPVDLSDYYNKTEVDDLLDEKVDMSAFTENEEVVAGALNDLNERKLDASAYTPVDLSGYYNKTEVDDKLDDKLDASAYTPVDLSNYYNKTEVDSVLSGKQDTLVSGTSIKTVNGESLIGSGNVETDNAVFGRLDRDGFHEAYMFHNTIQYEQVPVDEPSWDKMYVDIGTNKLYKWDLTNYVELSSGSSSADLSNYYNKQEIDEALSGKQDVLVIDTELDSGSTNPVVNSAITTSLNELEEIVGASLWDLNAKTVDNKNAISALTEALGDYQEKIDWDGNGDFTKVVGDEGIDIEAGSDEGVVKLVGGLRYVVPNAIYNLSKPGKYITISNVSTQGDLNFDGIADINDALMLIDLIMTGYEVLSSSAYSGYSDMNYYTNDETFHGKEAFRYWYSKLEDEELAKRIANFIGYYNENVVNYCNENYGYELTEISYNQEVSVVQMTGYMGFLDYGSISSSISIIEKKKNGSLVEIANYYCKDFSFASDENNNVSFTRTETPTGFRIKANVDVFDCGEFEGEPDENQVNSNDETEAETDTNPQDPNSGDAPDEPIEESLP